MRMDATLVTGFRSMMAAFPTGVAVVTTTDADGQPKGMTCSALCSVTLTPPTILICLRCGSPTLDAIVRQEKFAVNLLHHQATAVAALFASGDPSRFDRVYWRFGAARGGPELAADAHAAAHCQLIRADHMGDHVVVYGEVFNVWESAERRRPLLYGLRQYEAWPDRERTVNQTSVGIT
jgi:flavin reductase (NADH)